MSTTKIPGSTVTYARDATDRFIARAATGGPAVRYSHTDRVGIPPLVLDTSNNVLDATYVLPGGVIYHLHGANKDWSYPNLHGDIAATANSFGTKVGSTINYYPCGNVTAGTAPGTCTANMGDGWLGTHQCPPERAAGLRPTLEMGARQNDATVRGDGT